MGGTQDADTNDTRDHAIEALRRAVRYLYDLQKLRISSGHRSTTQASPAVLDEQDKAFLEQTADGLKALEMTALKEVKRHLARFPVWKGWLEDQRGVGPAMGGVLVGELICVSHAERPSQWWSYAGLGVKDGHAQRRTRGEKCGYNPWLKSKLLEVLGKCLIRAGAPLDAVDAVLVAVGSDADIDADADAAPVPRKSRRARGPSEWYEVYAGRKHRRQHQPMPVCMGCNGIKKRKDPKDPKVEVPCWNCAGTGGPAPWGKGDDHREIDARRYMVKMFLLGLWEAWRKAEGLPPVVPYHEAKLGLVHGGRA